MDSIRPHPLQEELLRSILVSLQIFADIGGWEILAGGSNSEPISTIALPAVPHAYQLIQEVTRSSTALMTKENNPKPHDEVVRRCLPLVTNGLEHWALQDSRRLGVWLSGSMPPPRCGAFENSVRCIEIVNYEGALCNKYHKCLSQMSRECILQRQPNSPFCISHGCQHNKCTSEQIPISSYCDSHSCPGCIVSNEEHIGDSLPFACLMHQCKGHLRAGERKMSACNQSALLPHSYCFEHCCVECGESGSVLGHPQSDQSKLCFSHKCQIDSCKSIRSGSTRYCSMHVCSLCEVEADPSRAEYRNSGCKGTVLCKDHKCAQAGCIHARLSGPVVSPQSGMVTRSSAKSSTSTIPITSTEQISLYCKEHTCRKCFLSAVPCLLSVEDVYPRNVCTDHTLCSFITNTGHPCNSLADLSSLLYCSKHERDSKEIDDFVPGSGHCCGIATRTRSQCQTVGFCDTGGEWWCKDHLSQKPIQEEVIKKDDRADDDDIKDDGYDVAVSRRLRTIPSNGTQDAMKHLNKR